jgi:hypothetical protein
MLKLEKISKAIFVAFIIMVGFVLLLWGFITIGDIIELNFGLNASLVFTASPIFAWLVFNIYQIED